MIRRCFVANKYSINLPENKNKRETSFERKKFSFFSLYLRAMSYEFLILILMRKKEEKNIFMIIFPFEQLIKCFLSSRLF